MQSGSVRLAIAVGLGAAAAAVVAVVLLFYPVTAVTSGDPVPVVKEGGLEGYEQTVVHLGGDGLLADIADTPDKKSLGLGVRETMEEGEAMLFPFDLEGKHSFWMHGMKFPIDIIWLDSDKTVVHIEHSLQPCTPFDCPSYVPDKDAKYVLETVAGFSEKQGVVEGTQANFQLE
jgi:uncharacterized membrane protein (UPF0127 family)